MALVGELRIQAVPDSLRQIDYFIQGVGHRLRLSDESLQETDAAIKAAVEVILQHAYPPESTDDLILRIDTHDEDGNLMASTFARQERVAALPITDNRPGTPR